MIFLILAVLLSPNLSFARSSAHGGDLDRGQNSVWFVGDEPVSYCIERHEDYPLDLTALSDVVREAIEKWTRFFAKYGIDQKTFEGFQAKAPRLSMKFSQKKNCAGDDEELVFLFGKVNDLVRLHRPTESHSLAAAIWRGIDSSDFRSGGVVWFRNQRLPDKQLLHLVLHELGHVFGMPHDSVWVMREDIGEYMSLPSLKDPALGEIESPHWKYQLLDGDVIDFTYKGEVDEATGLPMVSNSRMGNHSISKFFSLPWGGKHSLRLKFTKKITLEGLWRKSFVLTVQTPTIKKRFEGAFDYLTSRAGGPSLYGKWKNGDGSIWVGKNYLFWAEFATPAHGYFKNAETGEVIPAIIKYDKGPMLGLFYKKPVSYFTSVTHEWWWTSTYERSNHDRAK